MLDPDTFFGWGRHSMDKERAFQKKILEELDRVYPDYVDLLFIEMLFQQDEALESERPTSLRRQIFYLFEHGLIEIDHDRHDNKVFVGKMRLTQSGIDFLKDDGGLSAILGTVTVRLHADTIRDLIEAKIIESSDISAEDKPRLVAALKGLREEGLKQLTQRIVTYGLDQGAVSGHNLWQWITG